jgi:hypothetical protein
MKITDDIVAFIGGATTGGGYGLVLLTMEWSEMIIQGPLKLFLVIVIYFCWGIAG